MEKILLLFKGENIGNFASNALDNLFWDAYTNKNYKKALQYGYIHAREYQNTIAAPKILFWMGKLSEKQGRKNEAKGFYQKTIETSICQSNSCRC